MAPGRPGTTVIATLVFVLGAGLAHATTFQAESVALATADDARRLKDAAGAVCAQCAVVRRFVPGEGWRHLVIAPPQPDAGAAQRVLDAFSKEGIGGTLWKIEGASRVALGSAPTAPAAVAAPRIEAPAEAAPPKREVARAEPPPPPPPRERAPRGAMPRLEDVAMAHGGAAGGATLLSAAAAVRFEFRREVVTDGLQARHVWWSRGPARRLEVEVEKGAGTSSVAVLGSGGQAWVEVEGVSTPRDAARTREVLDRFGPEEVLAIPLALGPELAAGGAWAGLEVAGEEGREVVLRAPAGSASGLVACAVTKSSGRLAWITWTDRGDETTLRLSDYTEPVPGLVVPRRMEILQGGRLVETIEVLSLDLAASPPARLFEGGAP